ncbi:hypothetical protein J2S74_000686 [Evansella vedderi]|uniref:Uncharacterized protein n=1 Tax=Evansella vedderi TaxID=38282 RepID=A0ABT9ZR17_9BACI|nr:hypothetical protein [Evansella vedderi]
MTSQRQFLSSPLCLIVGLFLKLIKLIVDLYEIKTNIDVQGNERHDK